MDAEQIVTHASITAKPFFESRGYRAVFQQHVIRHGVVLTNYRMEKYRPPAVQNACS